MGALRFLVFLKFIAFIDAVKPKSVNLALETVMEFNPKDRLGDIKFLDNIQEFINKVKMAVASDTPSRRSNTDLNNVKFTDFIKNVIEILQTYENDDLEDVFAVFDDEIRKYHYKGCKFYELVENQNVRRSVANNLDYIKNKPASKLRRSLDRALVALEDAKFNTDHVEFLDYVNSLYRHDSSDKLNGFLNQLKVYSSKSKRANLDLVKVMRNGIRSIIFDHYSGLTPNARRDLKIKLGTSWRGEDGSYNHRMWYMAVTNTVTHKKLKSNIDDFKRQRTSSVKVEKPNLKKDFEASTPTTPYYNHKQRHINHQIEFENEIEISKAKYVTPKKQKQKHKKLSSFITLYPEKITFSNKKRFKIESTTRKSKLYTLWEEKIKFKESKKKDMKRKSKNKSHFRVKADEPAFITEYDTIINVRAGYTNSRKELNRKPIRKLSKWYRAKTEQHNSESKSKHTTSYNIRRIPDKTSPFSDEGMSIEDYTTSKQATTEQTDTTKDEIKLKVLRRINNAEKQQDVNNTKKTEPKQTTNDYEATEYEPLKFWEGSTAEETTTERTTTEKSSNKTTISTQSNTTTTITEVQTSVTEDKITKQDETTTIKPVSQIYLDIKEYTIPITNISYTESSTTIKETTTTKSTKNSEILNFLEDNPTHELASQPNDPKLGMNFGSEVNNIIKKYNVTLKPVTRKHFDLDKFFEESVKRDKDPEKAKIVRDLMKNELKHIFEDTTKSVPNQTEATDDPLFDINSIF